jgi:hypothetical protein
MADKLMTHNEAGYRKTTSDWTCCATCSMYRKPARCTLVKSPIRPQDVCLYFERQK